MSPQERCTIDLTPMMSTPLPPLRDVTNEQVEEDDNYYMLVEAVLMKNRYLGPDNNGPEKIVKSVRFASIDENRIYEVEHRSNYTNREKKATWYNQRDYRQIKRDAYVILNLMDSGLPFVDDEDECARGLEPHAKKSAKAFNMTRKRATMAVLAEQERQRSLMQVSSSECCDSDVEEEDNIDDGRIDDDERGCFSHQEADLSIAQASIKSAYERIAMKCAFEAVIRARNDERDARQILDEDINLLSSLASSSSGSCIKQNGYASFHRSPRGVNSWRDRILNGEDRLY